MPIIVNLDVMLARRKKKSKELAAFVGITEQNISLLKIGKGQGNSFFDAGADLRIPRVSTRESCWSIAMRMKISVRGKRVFAVCSGFGARLNDGVMQQRAIATRRRGYVARSLFGYEQVHLSLPGR